MGAKLLCRMHLRQWNRPHTFLTPSSHAGTETRVRFGDFTADLSSQELFRAGAPV